jgi:hypothetical protein
VEGEGLVANLWTRWIARWASSAVKLGPRRVLAGGKQRKGNRSWLVWIFFLFLAQIWNIF